jgi:hypothetical protein
VKKIILLIIPLLSFSVSCENLTNNDNNEDEVEIVFNLEPRLDVDSNGYYHLTLNEGSWQTLHRISGHIYEDGNPLESVKFGWASSHYWYLTDTLGYIVNQGVNDEGQYVSIDTSYIVGFNGFEVPTINCCSYSNAEGEVNTMFAPVRSMRHDTVTVWVGFYDNEGQIQENTIEIVLE